MSGIENTYVQVAAETRLAMTQANPQATKTFVAIEFNSGKYLRVPLLDLRVKTLSLLPTTQAMVIPSPLRLDLRPHNALAACLQLARAATLQLSPTNHRAQVLFPRFPTSNAGQASSELDRARALVDKTRDFISVITNAIKYSEPKAFVAPPTPEKQSSALADYESDHSSELFYPTPPFARRFTFSSQRSGSTNSTSTAPSSIFSRHTYQTRTTVAGEGDEPCLEKDDGIPAVEEDVGGFGAAQDSDILTRLNESARDPSSFALQAESSDEESYPGQSSDDDEGVLFIRSERVKQPTFATSLTRDPYAAFLSRPSYKLSYVFPTTRRSVNS
ncbi:hypothetical protein FRC01_003157 [Tulasnella sp. 417]|nr:hypothetical protein FRC01_003157 [Tulasnella sp. 417]